jgi:hypothetical protein
LEVLEPLELVLELAVPLVVVLVLELVLELAVPLVVVLVLELVAVPLELY